MSEVRVRLPLGAYRGGAAIEQRVGKPGPFELNGARALGARDRQFESDHAEYQAQGDRSQESEDSGQSLWLSSCLLPPDACFLRWSSCWYEQAAVNRPDTGSIPVTAALRKGKPTGDGSGFESRRAMGLEGSTPSPSAVNETTCPWPSGKGASLPSWKGGSDSRRALSGIG